MILRLYAIIFTIIFPNIFPITSMSDRTRLFFRLFTIISRHWHPENEDVQTAILDPIMEE